MLHSYLNAMVTMRKQIGTPTGFAYGCMEDYVLREGQDFASEPLTDSEMSWLFALIGDSRFQIKQCYYNSQKVLIHASRFARNPDGHDLRYAEGYASGLIPVLHGWLSLNGKVVDLTMRLRSKLRRQSRVGRRRLQNRVLGEFPSDDRQYRGVTFETDFVLARVVATGMMGTLIDDWQNGYPLLKEAI
jgi:hypothetical protein